MRLLTRERKVKPMLVLVPTDMIAVEEDACRLRLHNSEVKVDRLADLIPIRTAGIPITAEMSGTTGTRVTSVGVE